MDRRTFVKASCLGSASLWVHGLDPIAGADVVPRVAPAIELQGLPNYKPSPLGMPGFFPDGSSRSTTRMRSRAIAFRSRLCAVCSSGR